MNSGKRAMLKAAELIIMKKEGGIDLIRAELQMWYSESTEVRCLRLKWVRKMMPQSMGIQPAFFDFRILYISFCKYKVMYHF